MALAVGFMTAVLSGCAQGAESPPAASTVPTAAPQVPSGQSASPQPTESAPTASWIPPDLGARFQQQARKLGARADLGLVDMAGGVPFASTSTVPPLAYSTIKVAIVATYLRLDPTPSPRDSALIQKAITQSHNAATEDLFEAIGRLSGGRSDSPAALQERAAAEVERTLEMAGDNETDVLLPKEVKNVEERTRIAGYLSGYGQSRWEVDDQVNFIANLLRGCVLNQENTRKVTELMKSIDSSGRWGLSKVEDAGPLKGGWGLEADEVRGTPPGWYVRQVVQITPTKGKGGPYVMAIAVHLDNSSDYGSGKHDREDTALQSLGTWVSQQLGPAPQEIPCSEPAP